MGEYVKYRGREIKIGTCESMYYVRWQQMAEIVALGLCEKMPGNADPAAYVRLGSGLRFRFPFPDEDQIEPGDFTDHDKSVVIGIPAGCPVCAPDDCHETVCQSINCRGGGYNVNAIIPCPATAAFATVKHSPIGGTIPLEIVQQKPMEDGAVWTVVRCGWCSGMYRLGREEAAWLSNYIREQYSDEQDAAHEFWHTIAARIDEGYKVEALAV
jgi:hypothetical protein